MRGSPEAAVPRSFQGLDGITPGAFGVTDLGEGDLDGVAVILVGENRGGGFVVVLGHRSGDTLAASDGVSVSGVAVVMDGLRVVEAPGSAGDGVDEHGFACAFRTVVGYEAGAERGVLGVAPGVKRHGGRGVEVTYRHKILSRPRVYAGGRKGAGGLREGSPLESVEKNILGGYHWRVGDFAFGLAEDQDVPGSVAGGQRPDRLIERHEGAGMMDCLAEEEGVGPLPVTLHAGSEGPQGVMNILIERPVLVTGMGRGARDGVEGPRVGHGAVGRGPIGQQAQRAYLGDGIGRPGTMAGAREPVMCRRMVNMWGPQKSKEGVDVEEVGQSCSSSSLTCSVVIAGKPSGTS